MLGRALHPNLVRLLTAGLVGLSLLTAGCGGSEAAPVGTPNATAGGPRLVFSGVGRAFSACMRTHGAPNVPDPDVRGQLLITGIDPNSPQFRSAEKDCQRFIPEQQPPSPGQQAHDQAQALRFAACMRSHGVPSFPDPTFSRGNIGQRGIDPRSPRVRTAQRDCAALSVFPG